MRGVRPFKSFWPSRRSFIYWRSRRGRSCTCRRVWRLQRRSLTSGERGVGEGSDRFSSPSFPWPSGGFSGVWLDRCFSIEINKNQYFTSRAWNPHVDIEPVLSTSGSTNRRLFTRLSLFVTSWTPRLLGLSHHSLRSLVGTWDPSSLSILPT